MSGRDTSLGETLRCSPFVRKNLVIVESPFKGKTEEELAKHKEYLVDAVKDCLGLGEAPFAMHGFYPLFLDEDDVKERALGITCGLNWMACANVVAFYYDLGISAGMREGILHAARNNLRIEFRSLDKWRKG